MKVEIDEELWYGASSDEVAEAQAAKSMAARMGRIVGAKPFPAAAHRLSVITQDPNCQMDEVVAVLESDPALSARLLRLVNSVGFSLRTACTSVRHAAALVGTEKLHQVASTAAILDMYESGGERAKELLEHATVVGTLCRYLAFHFGLPPDELFTCGFLHDIGKLMLLDTEGSEYLELLGSELPDFDKTYVEERKRYGFDHALLAGHVLAAWNIPHPVPKVVAWHHHVTRAYAESTAISQMVSTLRLADAMSFALTKVDAQAEIENIARMEAASYMDISEGQLAAMWEEVRSLTERARAVFRGEKVEDQPLIVHTSRPSGASLRAVARARNSMRGASNPALSMPSLSGPARQFPCVACGAPSYAHRCSACQGYMCPLHVAKEDEWCQLCQRDYEEAGIPSIRPLVSTLFGALAGGLVAAAFFGAASAGAQRPLRIMLGPTLILMLLGMLAGVGQRWVRRWWFLRARPNRASIVPKAVDALLGSAAQHNPQIIEIETVESAQPSGLEPGRAQAKRESPAPASTPEQLLLLNPEIPALPALPHLDSPLGTALSAPPRVASAGLSGPHSQPPRSAPRSSPPRARTWMSSRTPHPTAVAERLAAPSDAPPASPSDSRAEEDAPQSSAPETRAVPMSEERPIRAEHSVDDEALEPELAVAAGGTGGMRTSARSGSVRPPAADTRGSSASSRNDRGSVRPRPSGAPRIGSERPVARIRASNDASSNPRARSLTPAATPSARARLAAPVREELQAHQSDDARAAADAAAAAPASGAVLSTSRERAPTSFLPPAAPEVSARDLASSEPPPVAELTSDARELESLPPPAPEPSGERDLASEPPPVAELTSDARELESLPPPEVRVQAPMPAAAASGASEFPSSLPPAPARELGAPHTRALASPLERDLQSSLPPPARKLEPPRAAAASKARELPSSLPPPPHAFAGSTQRDLESSVPPPVRKLDAPRARSLASPLERDLESSVPPPAVRQPAARQRQLESSVPPPAELEPPARQRALASEPPQAREPLSLPPPREPPMLSLPAPREREPLSLPPPRDLEAASSVESRDERSSSGRALDSEPPREQPPVAAAASKATQQASKRNQPRSTERRAERSAAAERASKGQASAAEAPRRGEAPPAPEAVPAAGVTAADAPDAAQQDSGAAPARGAWSTLLDEGTAGGW